ncbi:MAG TPA: hypothetical protein VNA19_09290 [Pyrinomonadaceae bacterium]|jgi:hypothetical protein|nr:hypothetical protein [Pyrinomonadaceae bacterium]
MLRAHGWQQLFIGLNVCAVAGLETMSEVINPALKYSHETVWR